ncbi:MAG: NAD(P)/FAD-dependent oxidoreductase [Xanthomonadaceae bacterium]|nr:NAD(P)/FAD-dependent oxidoreductase [Xanthomonadaceae bacterium]
MNHDQSRRNFLKLGGAALAAGTVGAAAGATGAAIAGPSGSAAVASGAKASLPKAKGPRLVVVGGGTSGLTIAKYAKREYPKFDVVLVEKRDMYSSCFSSNLWYAGLINLEFLADHSFLDAAKNNDYIYFNATVTGLDRAGRKLITSEGEIDYDFLVLAPGISYDYEKIGVKDPEAVAALRQTYPGGFVSPTEHVSIHRKVREFEGGVFLQTVPSGNYRCLPAPYERACMIASVIKRNKLKGKVLVLDANPEITIKQAGFHAAFDELYKDIIEWRPSSPVTGVDVGKKLVHTEFDAIPFDDAAIYANVRASTLIEKLGLMAPPSKSNQKEANVDTRFYNVAGDLRVYVTGDSRPQPYSKSANTSNTEGHHVARMLAARAQGKEPVWAAPRTICYSMVNAAPMEAISVDAGYDYDAAKDEITGFSKDTRTFEKRDAARGQATLEWARGIYRDMFEA